ncbi:hypothetical protein BGW38_010853, partial [Lunasporangiospora selenospora]
MNVFSQGIIQEPEEASRIEKHGYDKITMGQREITKPIPLLPLRERRLVAYFELLSTILPCRPAPSPPTTLSPPIPDLPYTPSTVGPKVVYTGPR